MTPKVIKANIIGGIILVLAAGILVAIFLM